MVRPRKLGGVALVALLGASSGHAVYWLLPVSAASFLYIACSNLLPELRQPQGRFALLLQMMCLFGGAALVALLARLPGA